MGSDSKSGAREAVLDMQIVLQHGWALDQSIWAEWEEQLSKRYADASILTAERGYFGAPAVIPEFTDQKGKKIIICHSYGLHLLPIQLLKECDCLVAISSFSSFHTAGASERSSRRTVKRMIQKLERNTADVLRDFYVNSEFSDTVSNRYLNDAFTNLNLEALANDTIVPVEKAHNLDAQCLDGQISVHPVHGHALFHSDSRWCLNEIEAALRARYEVAV